MKFEKIECPLCKNIMEIKETHLQVDTPKYGAIGYDTIGRATIGRLKSNRYIQKIYICNCQKEIELKITHEI